VPFQRTFSFECNKKTNEMIAQPPLLEISKYLKEIKFQIDIDFKYLHPKANDKLMSQWAEFEKAFIDYFPEKIKNSDSKTLFTNLTDNNIEKSNGESCYFQINLF
jgi:hypothetical protein